MGIVWPWKVFLKEIPHADALAIVANSTFVHQIISKIQKYENNKRNEINGLQKAEKHSWSF